MQTTDKETSKKSVNIRINPSTFESWKQYCSSTDRTVTELIKDAVRDFINLHPIN